MTIGPVYSIPLVHLGGGEYQQKADSGGGSSTYPVTLGSGYADTFRRDRAPTQPELLSNLVGTAYRCADLNSNLLANQRLRLYVTNQKGKEKAKFVSAAERLGRKVTAPVPRDRIKKLKRHGSGAVGKSALLDAVEQGDGAVEEVTSHPILDLLRNPEKQLVDAGLSAWDHRWVTQIFLESIGRAYWLITDRDKWGQPTQLLMLRAQMVRETMDTTGKTYILKYGYGTQNYSPADVIRFAMPDPSNPHLGFLSPMRAAIEKVRLARGDDAFTNALLQNGGYPIAMWSPTGTDEGGGIGSVEARRMRSTFRTAFSMANAGQVFVAEHPGTLQSLAFKPTEIISQERHDQLVGEIADCFGVPRTKIFRDTSAKTSGEGGDIDHARDAGLSRCSRYEETLNKQLVPLFDDTGRMFLAFDSPVPDDKEYDLKEFQAAMVAGVITIDQGLASLGMDPDPQIGDCRILSKGAVIVKADGTPLNPPPPPPDVSGGDDEEPPATGKPDSNADVAKALRMLTGIVRKLVKKKRRKYSDDQPRDEDGEWSGGGSGRESSAGNRTTEETPDGKSKAQIAKQSATYVGKDIQRYAEEHNEPQFAKSVGGLSYADNEPVDVVAGKNGVITDGVELKTMVSNKASKLTMDKYAQVRKVTWEAEKKATFHTVVIDDRNVFNANGEGEHDESQRTYYYRRGVAGSARVESMHQCKNIAEVKKLMKAPESELPKGAQRTDAKMKVGKWKAFVDKDGKGFKNSKSGEVVRPKK